MKAVRAVLDYLVKGNVEYIFGIPAGSVNAFFDELYTMEDVTPIVTKHEGAAGYMAAAYAKASDRLAVCIGCSGPGSTNLLTGAANAMREHVPVLFLTGAVPVRTVGLNASQELDVEPLFRPVTKYSVTVQRPEDLLKEVARAVEIALTGVPGPVHVAMPIDVQLTEINPPAMPAFPQRKPVVPNLAKLQQAAKVISEKQTGIILAGQGIRHNGSAVLELAELLNWPILTTPQAKGLLPDTHPLVHGVFGFAGHETASEIINDAGANVLLVLGSSLGETATNNYNANLTANRYLIQIDLDASVFTRAYDADLPIVGDTGVAAQMLINELQRVGRTPRPELAAAIEAVSELKAEAAAANALNPHEFNTQNVLLQLQNLLPPATRYTIDIGEFMSYVIHYMRVPQPDSFDINVHFGAMGSAIGGAIGLQLADSSRPIACITGDGCFFMHGMEILTAKEYQLPILFVVMNNSRLGMVWHGHKQQYKRVHPRFEQQPVNIAAMAAQMGIPSARIESMEALTQELLDNLQAPGPSLLEVALIDSNTPPMGDRVKFLSSFGK